ncbi:hypothetical protein [Pedobacter sp. P26]|uniref:hypothetical protein n=1 Tax=Pedobacter sp. P26 TaxID=3423956 RepID=UPI003D6643DD
MWTRNSAIILLSKNIKFLLIAFVLINPVFVKGQGIRTKAEVEVAEIKLRRLGQTENKVDLLVDAGTYYLNLPGEVKADLATAMNLQGQAFGLAQKIEYPRGIARSIVLKGNILRESGDKAGSTKTYNQAIAYTSKFDLKDQLAEAYAAIGALFSNEGTDLEKRLATMKNRWLYTVRLAIS